MIKELFSLALLALMTTSAWAQENYTKTSELAQEKHVKISINAGLKGNSALGGLAGVDVHIPFGQSRWGFEPGLYWSFRNHGSEKTVNSTKQEYSTKAHYLDIPLRFTVDVAGSKDGPFYMSVLMGPYLAYGLSGTSHSTTTIDGQVTKSEVNAFSSEGRLKSRFDYGINMGANAIIKQHFKVGIFTEIGFRDIYRPMDDVEDLLGTVFAITKINIGAGITVGYQF